MGHRNMISLLGRTALMLPCALVCVAMSARQDAAPPVKFVEHFVGKLPGAYQCSVVDINGDGKPDIIGVSSGKSEIVWFENPSWKRHVITTATQSNIDAAAFDLDGDGKPEIVVASEFDLGNSRKGGRLQWFKQGPDPNAEWTGHDFASLPTAHRVRWIDWDGDGRKELVVTPILGPGATVADDNVPVSIVSYAFEHGVAHAYTVDNSLNLAHGVRVLDFYGDGRGELLVASLEGITLLQPIGKGLHRTWKKTLLADGDAANPQRHGCSEVDRGWLKGKRAFLATIEPWHGNQVVVYTPPSDGKGLWKRHVIDDTLEDGHALGCVDLDGDGNSEIIVGYRGGGHNLYGYRCIDAAGEKWERFVIDAGDMAGSGLVIADINGDGRPDIVSCGTATENVKWYENIQKRP